VLEHLFATVPHGGVWVDVGANIGNHTVYFSNYLADRVIAIEPHPETHALLAATVQRNRLHNVETHAIGASDTTGQTGMSVPTEHDGDLIAAKIDPASATVIQLDTLDRLLKDVPAVRLIKIDVEGHEMSVVRGAMEIIRRDRPDLVAEAHTEQHLAELLALLSPLGYRVVHCAGWSPTYHIATWSYGRLLWFKVQRKLDPWFNGTGMADPTNQALYRAFTRFIVLGTVLIGTTFFIMQCVVRR
jgi:FkbM family methyltransferase